MNTISFTVEQARGMVVAAPQSDPRWYLNGVKFEFESGRAVITDGHILVMASLDTFFDDAGFADVIIRREDIAAIAKGGKKTDLIRLTCGAFDDGHTARLCRQDGDFVNVSPIDGRFPDYERVIPEKITGETGQYDPDLVARCAKSLRMLCAPSEFSSPQIMHNGESAGIMAYNGCGAKAIAVVMPLGVKKLGFNGKAEMQEFLKVKKPDQAKAA